MNTSFHPTPRTLMGPGPSDVHPRVLGAMGKATIGHLDPEFQGLMEEIKDLKQTLGEDTLKTNAVAFVSLKPDLDKLEGKMTSIIKAHNAMRG